MKSLSSYTKKSGTTKARKVNYTKRKNELDSITTAKVVLSGRQYRMLQGENINGYTKAL